MVNQNPDEKFAYLDQLSTQELEALIRADVDSPENQNDEAVFHILEVLHERTKQDPDAVTLDKDELWRDIQSVYHTPEGEDRVLYPQGEEKADHPVASGSAQTKKRPYAKWALSAAAVVAVALSANLVCARATGFDVFGFLVQHTADVFRYKTDSELCSQVQEVFDQNHIPVELAPKWYPEGFEIGETEVYAEEFSNAIFVSFDNQKEGKFFSVQICRYSSKEELAALNLQWELDSQEEYTSGDKTFFLVSNNDYTTATWSDRETLMMTIIGDLTLQETQKIIDSIGG